MWVRLARILGVLLCLLVLFVPAYDGQAPFDAPPDFDNPDGGRILDYTITVDVDAEGALEIDHAIRMLVPEGFHGVSFTQTRTPSGANFRFLLSDFRARLDGEDVDDAVWLDPELRVQRVSVGSDEGLSAGEHLFEFGFRMLNGVGPPIETPARPHEHRIRSELLAFPTGGWPMSIDRLTVRYRLPGDAVVAECDIGTIPCTVEGRGTQEVTLTGTDLRPLTSIHAVLGLSSVDPGRHRALWQPAADPVLGQSIEPVGRLLVLCAIAVMAGVFLSGRVRQRQQFRAVYEPPSGVGPAQAALLLGDVPQERAGRATLMHLARVLEPTADGFRDIGAPEDWSRLDPVSRSFGEALLGGTPLDEASRELVQHARVRTIEQGHLVRDRLAVVARYVLVPVALVAALVLMVVNPLRMSLTGLPFALFVVFAGDVLLPGALTRRSDSGRILWARTAGFRQVLSGNVRVGLDQEPALYDAWLPWAVAFGCEAQWQQRYAEEVGASLANHR